MKRETSLTYANCGQYEKAIDLYNKVIKKNPEHLFAQTFRTACLSLLGRKEEANKSAEEVLKINPKISLDFLADFAPFKNKSDVERIIEALRKAGLPEHSPKE